MKESIIALAHIIQFTSHTDQMENLFNTCYNLLKYKKSEIKDINNLISTHYLITLIVRYF